MQAVDTNILVYAEVEGSSHHGDARRLLVDLANGPKPWAIPWPCVNEFLRVVSHHRIFHPPSPILEALEDMKRILDSPSLQMLHETPDHWSILTRVLDESGASGNLIHDAHIAALCIEHGVSELITADRDFARFPSLRIHNPFA